MKATYWQKGEVLDFTPTEDVENGQVIPVGSRVGIAATDIAAGTPGHLYVVGVFEMDKTEGEAITLGTPVYYDATADAITATQGSNTPAGYAAADASEEAAVVLVKLLG